jgi:ribosomal protein L39E
MITRADGFTCNKFHPFTYVTSLANKYMMNFAETIKQNNKVKFVEAMEQNKVADHAKQNHWKGYS